MSYELLGDYGDNPTLSSHPEVPAGYVMESAGGISNMHGSPQGPYSESATRSDMYAYSLPQNLSLPYHNLYQSGSSYIEDQIPIKSNTAPVKSYPYEYSPDYELIEGFQPLKTNPINPKLSFVIIFIFLVIFYIVIHYWIKTGDKIIIDYFIGNNPTIIMLSIVTLILTTILFIAYYSLDI